MFAGGRGEGWLRAQEGECYVGRRAPPTPPWADAQTGRGRRAPRPRGRGARGGAARVSPPPRRHRPGHPGLGGGWVPVATRPLCGAAQATAAAGGLCPRPAGGTGGSQPGRPLPGRSRAHPLQLPRALRPGRRRCSLRLGPLGLRSCRRRGGGGSRSPGPGRLARTQPGAAGARSRSGQGLHGPGRLFIFFLVSRRPPGRSWAGGGARRCWVSGGESGPPAARAGTPARRPPPPSCGGHCAPWKTPGGALRPEERRSRTKGGYEAAPGALQHRPGLRRAQPLGRVAELGVWKKWGAQGTETKLDPRRGPPCREAAISSGLIRDLGWIRGPGLQSIPFASQKATCRPLDLGPQGALGVFL